MPMMFPMGAAMGPAAIAQDPKRDWRASLFDRLMPDDGLKDDDKEAAMRQGLLGLASGLLGTGGGFGNALSAGIQSGLLATNQSVDSQQDRAYKQQLMEQGLAGPAGMREFQSLTNGLTPEEIEKAKRIRLGLEGRASSAGFQKVEVVDENGNPRLGTLNGRTGQIDFPDGTSFNPQTGVTIPTMQAQPGPDPRMAPPLNPEQDFGSLTSRFGITPSSTVRTPERNSRVGGVANSFHLTGEAADYPVPAAQKPQFIAEARRMGYQAIDEGDHVHIEPPRRGMTANPFKGRRAEDEAAAVAAAKERVALSMLPARNRLEAEGAGMTTAAQEAARTAAEFAAYDQMVANEENKARRLGAVKNEVEQSAKQTEKDAALRLYEAGMTGVTDGLGQANTGPIIGRLPAVTTEQQIAQGGVAAIAPVLKQLFRTAGEGTFTDKDQELLMQMIPTRIDTPESIEWKLQNIDRIVKAKLNAAPEAGGLDSLSDEDLLRQLGGM